MTWELFSLERLQELAQHYGYGAVFLGVALENAGVPIPGETITLLGGFLAGNGELLYGGVLLMAIAGAVVGDSCGYWLGRMGGWPLLNRICQWFKIPSHKIETAQRRFSQNAGQAVFWGRFVTLLRIFAGPMAGITKMPYPKFLLFNIGGASIWGTIMVSLAYFLGQLASIEQIITWVSQAGGLILIAVVTGGGIYIWANRQRAETS